MFYTTKAQSLKRLKSQILDVSSIRSSLISFSWHLRKEKSRAVNIFLIFYRCLRKGLSEEKRAPISVQIIDLRNKYNKTKPKSIVVIHNAKFNGC